MHPTSQDHTDLVETLRGLGLPATRVLGSGMEGTVVDLDDETVVKLWFSRTTEELHRLREFYDGVAASGFALGVPRIVDVLAVGDRQATRQLRLEGEPLWSSPGVSPPTDAEHVAALVSVLEALAATGAADALAVLPVLEGEPAFDPRVPFGESLAGLVERRVARHPGPLQTALPGLEKVVDAVTGGLRALPPRPVALLHGDLVPGNVLVREGAPAAVLDFGFLSTLGDPAFDAAVTTSVYDMYGPDAAATEAVLESAVVQRLGHDPALLDLYRAAYALTTATCFSASGSDGHFAWCVRVLERPRVRDALGL